MQMMYVREGLYNDEYHAEVGITYSTRLYTENLEAILLIMTRGNK